jgi:hypothetical protein
MTPVQRNHLLFRTLIILAIPACGFISAASAFLGFYQVDELWPYIMLPASILIPGAIIADFFLSHPKTEELNSRKVMLINRFHLMAIIIFSVALIWWLIYFALYVELHK